MTRPAVLRPGDRVVFDGGEHQVLGLVGTSVRLRSDDGVEQVVLVSHLLSCPDFELRGQDHRYTRKMQGISGQTAAGTSR